MKHIFHIHNRLLRVGLACMTVITVTIPIAAQQRTPAYSFEKDYIFWGYPSIYLDYQARIAYPLIDRMLQAYPPTEEMDKNRRMAIIALDQFLHDAEYSRRDAFYKFVDTRMARMLAEMNQPVLACVRLYKLYDNGFILKTLKTTIAIDVIPGGTTYKPFLTDSVIDEIASRCNVLLITNSDSKHANKNVAQAFVDKGKKVILPNGLWTKMEDDVVYAGADTIQTMEIGEMTLHILPGHQGNTKNNIYVMDFHGRGVVAHTGAQDNDADWSWIDKIHDKFNTDVLLTKSQNINLESMLAGFRPRMVITTNENEMESAVDKRESYWTTQKRMNSLAAIGIPNIIMTWGEAYDYADTESENISSSATKVMMNGVMYIERKGAVYTPTGIKVK